MPFCSTCDNYFSFNRRLAALATWTEEFSSYIFFGDAFRQLNIDALLTLSNASQTLRSLLVWFWIERYTLEVDATFIRPAMGNAQWAHKAVFRLTDGVI
ncbi:hypothetical protein KCU99_g162, partial [Aureobasidium melanogenum]